MVISQALADYYQGALPTLANKLFVAHDGADPARSTTPDAPAASGATRRPRVVYVGSLFAGKGMELIAEIAPRLPGFDFVVAGGSGPLLDEWRGRVREQQNVAMLGHLPHRDVPALIAGADVVVAPYLRRVITVDGAFDAAQWMSPLKIFEYMAHGKAIVTSDLPVIREILRAGDTALLCDPDDPSAWVAAIRAIVADPQLRARLQANALDAFTRQHSWDRRARALLAGIDGVAAA